MAIQLFNEEEDISLKEYSEDPNYEDYAGIVLDKDKNQFKVVTGKFTDKKDFYNKMADRGLILRKCFEIRVYNWIKENAKTTLDAYLMLSTAFSKWKGNNMLSGYYNKLLTDIPELNREGQKGNPNTRGKKEEAVLEEDDSNVDVYKLFADTSIPKTYIDALNISDPHDSAVALVKARLSEQPIYLQDIKHSTHTSLSHNLNKEINKQMDPEKYIPDHGRIDPDTLKYRDTQINRLSPELYNISITPAIGYTDDVITLGKGNDKYPAKEKNVKWLYPEKADTTLTTELNQVPLPNYKTGNSVSSCLNNNSVLKAISDAYIEGASKYGYNRCLGVYLKVYEPVGKSKSDIIQSGKEVTSTLDSAARSNPQRTIDVYDLDHNLIQKDALYSNAGLKEDGFFIDRNFIRSKIALLKQDSQYIQNTQDDKVQSYLDTARVGREQERSSKTNTSKKYSLQNRFARLYNDIATAKNTFEANNPDNPMVVEHKQQVEFLKQKTQQLNLFDRSSSKETIIRKGAINVIKDILLPTVNNDYTDKFIDMTPWKRELDVMNNELEKQEILDKSEFANISKVNQGSTLHDKLMRVRDAQFNGKPLYGDKEGNISINKDKAKNKDSKSKEKKPEISKEDRLLNNIARLKNAVKSWEFRASKARGKDKEEAEAQMSKNNDALIQALADYEEYVKNNPSPAVSEPINPNATGELNVEEAYVNDGATGYYIDQQSAAKNALAGKFITEEITHSELNPVLFDGETLKPDVLDAFLAIADKFKQTLNISIDPVDVYFTGSNANYNYNENSDIDLHLVYDFEKVGIAAEILEKYLRDAKRLFNLDYDEIKVKGIRVEVGYENLATPLVATAIYSLRNNAWVKKPEMKASEISDPDTEAYNDITSRIESAIQDKDLNTLEALWKEIGELRKQSLNLEGEFGQGNALFKKLRNLGAIGRLRNAYYQAASKDLSLESNGVSTNE